MGGTKPIVYHIPVCPFSSRLECLLETKGLRDHVEFSVVDITKPRSPELLKKTDGTTALPVLELPDGRVIKESLVILTYLDEAIGRKEDGSNDTLVRRVDPAEHALELMLVGKEAPLVPTGYLWVMNRDPAKRDEFREKLLKQYREIDAFLVKYTTGDGPLLFNDRQGRLGLSECVFAPIFARFQFLDYYEKFELPDTPDLQRFAAWRKACLTHPAAQQATTDQIIKLYFDYALGYGNGAVPEGRKLSSFVFEPAWDKRPMPPSDKYGEARTASDELLGLIA